MKFSIFTAEKISVYCIDMFLIGSAFFLLYVIFNNVCYEVFNVPDNNCSAMSGWSHRLQAEGIYLSLQWGVIVPFSRT